MNDGYKLSACLKEIREVVDNRLFELRQFPKMTQEQRSLSKIELIIHEYDEMKVEVNR